MKLYGSLTSPYVRKCRILIKEKTLPCEFVIAAYTDAPVAPLNPLGKVPVLQRDDGSGLFDSPVIVEYLDAFKTPALLAPAGEERWQMLRMQALADGILDATVTRMTEGRRPLPQQSAETIARQEEKVSRALAFADSLLKGGPYLIQDRFTLADLCLGVALEYVDFRYPHDWRGRHPRLAAWLAGISARPAFAETVPPGMERAAPSPR